MKFFSHILYYIMHQFSYFFLHIRVIFSSILTKKNKERRKNIRKHSFVSTNLQNLISHPEYCVTYYWINICIVDKNYTGIRFDIFHLCGVWQLISDKFINRNNNNKKKSKQLWTFVYVEWNKSSHWCETWKETFNRNSTNTDKYYDISCITHTQTINHVIIFFIILTKIFNCSFTA